MTTNRSRAGCPADISAADARLIACAGALGDRPYNDAAEVLEHLRLLQLDPMARVAKAHQLTCLTRMSPASRLFSVDSALWSNGPAVAFEAWVHAVCLVPVEDWPLLRLSRERALQSPKRPDERVLSDVRRVIVEAPEGATISEIEDPGNTTRGWEWSQRKRAIEYMLRSGELVCTARRGQKRVFDLPERRIPADVLQTEYSREDIIEKLAKQALSVLGVATAQDVATYYNISVATATDGLAAAGAIPLRVADWTTPAWALAANLDPNGTTADTTTGPLLIGPFDNLMWDRKRTQRVFGFDYTLEAYKPAAKRTYGYYVLSLIVDNQFLGRADIRRSGDLLEIIAAYPEVGSKEKAFKVALETARRRLSLQFAGK